MNTHPNFEVVEMAGVSRSGSGELNGFGICVSCLSVTQVNCDMTLIAAVMCLVYEGPQDNCYWIRFYECIVMNFGGFTHT
jgi:hypothetical protein